MCDDNFHGFILLTLGSVFCLFQLGLLNKQLPEDGYVIPFMFTINNYLSFAGREVCIGLEYGPRPQAEGCTQD